MQTINFEIIDSTNSYLKQNYQDLENFTFVSADYQTAGRGRERRTWYSVDKQNLLFSILIKDEQLIEKFKAISIISAYTIIEVLRAEGLTGLSIKWPNDVYCQDKKLAGILLEAISRERLACLVVGVGLNVNQKNFGNDLKHPATSLSLELNKEINIDYLKKKIYQQFITNLNSLKEKDCFYEEIVKLNYLKDKEVEAIINNQQQSIKVLSINKDYSLKIETNHQVKDIETGEITFHL